MIRALFLAGLASAALTANANAERDIVADTMRYHALMYSIKTAGCNYGERANRFIERRMTPSYDYGVVHEDEVDDYIETIRDIESIPYDSPSSAFMDLDSQEFMDFTCYNYGVALVFMGMMNTGDGDEIEITPAEAMQFDLEMGKVLNPIKAHYGWPN
jgi:hypothetical protein